MCLTGQPPLSLKSINDHHVFWSKHSPFLFFLIHFLNHQNYILPFSGLTFTSLLSRTRIQQSTRIYIFFSQPFASTMNLPEFPSDETSSPSSKKELQIQGPRPPPLRVSKESHKIKKPPLPPPHAVSHPPPPEHRQPVIIYSVSPKVLHVAVNDFMNVVQRLTGPSSGEDSALRSGDVSPAARLASIEKTSPSEKERVHGGGDDMTWLLEGIEMGQFPGILSPAPATLPPISSGFFSPAMDPLQTTSVFNEFSPFWSANSFVASPSGLLSAAMVSPLPSPDLFNIFD